MTHPSDTARRLWNEEGAAIIYVALCLVFFLGIAALATDVGYHRVVRNQLQNAADASALAACNMLYSRDPASYPPPPPDWTAAIGEARDATTINRVDNRDLRHTTTLVGWWNAGIPSRPDQWATQPAGRPRHTAPAATYGPGVRVSIAKTAGQNDGPIINAFGRILGVTTTDASATATAVAASPGTVRSGALIPVAISRRVADRYQQFNSPSQPITIGSPYKYLDTLAGQWTTFSMDVNDTTTVRGLIDDGNPGVISFGDKIWIVPGVHDTAYDSVSQPSINRNYAHTTVWLPVVDSVLRESTHSQVRLAGVIPFYVVCAGKGCNGMTPSGKNSEKVIMGYFKGGPFYGGPLGPHYGPLDRCRLYR